MEVVDVAAPDETVAETVAAVAAVDIAVVEVHIAAVA